MGIEFIDQVLKTYLELDKNKEEAKKLESILKEIQIDEYRRLNIEIERLRGLFTTIQILALASSEHNDHSNNIYNLTAKALES